MGIWERGRQHHWDAIPPKWLQLGSWNFNCLIHPFPPKFQNIIAPKPLEVGTWNFDTMFTTNIHNTCHVSGVACQVSHVNCNSETVRAREPKFWEKVHLLPPVICLVSCVSSHASHVMCHVSCITCNVTQVTGHMSCNFQYFVLLL